MRFPEEPVASIYFITFPTQIFIGLCLFWSLIFDIKELTFFSLIVLVISVGTRLWSRASQRNVKCRITANRTRLFPGETLRLTMRIINNKFLPVLVKIMLPLDRSFTGYDNSEFISREYGLLWFQESVDFKDIIPAKRGVFNIGAPFMRVGDIFGIFPREKHNTGDLEIIIFPRIVNVREISLPKREFYGIPGQKSPVEDPVFIFGTRDYYPGRPARNIHWKASARHNRLQEKLCEPAEQEKILVTLDVAGFYEQTDEQAFEKTLEVIASLMIRMDRLGYSIGFVTNGNITGKGSRIIPISGSIRQISSILEQLARLKMDHEEVIEDVLTRGYDIPYGVSCLHFSYEEQSAFLKTEAYYKERKIPVSFVFSQKSPSRLNGMKSNGRKVYSLEDILIGEEYN